MIIRWTKGFWTKKKKTERKKPEICQKVNLPLSPGVRQSLRTKGEPKRNDVSNWRGQNKREEGKGQKKLARERGKTKGYGRGKT